MLRFKYLCAFFILLSATKVHAQICTPPSVEFKAGYFFFADKKMRSVYKDDGLDVQISSSVPLNDCFQLYGSIEYLQKKGYSKGDHQKTTIWQVPVTVGLKGIAQLTPNVYSYLTVGPRFFYIHMHNDSSFVPRNLYNNGVGGFLGTGIVYTSCYGLDIDLFGEYSYERTRFHSSKNNVQTRNLQVGGFVFGAGLSYSF
jgi:hypothetical protein